MTGSGGRQIDRSARSNAQGVALLEPLPMGLLKKLTISADGYVPQETTKRLNIPTHNPIVIVKLKPAESIATTLPEPDSGTKGSVKWPNPAVFIPVGVHDFPPASDSKFYVFQPDFTAKAPQPSKDKLSVEQEHLRPWVQQITAPLDDTKYDKKHFSYGQLFTKATLTVRPLKPGEGDMLTNPKYDLRYNTIDWGHLQPLTDDPNILYPATNASGRPTDDMTNIFVVKGGGYIAVFDLTQWYSPDNFKGAINTFLQSVRKRLVDAGKK
jgi:hypothetical protein